MIRPTTMDMIDRAQDVLLRRSRRGGMLLNTEELISLVHLPSASVRVGKLRGPRWNRLWG